MRAQGPVVLGDLPSPLLQNHRQTQTRNKARRTVRQAGRVVYSLTDAAAGSFVAGGDFVEERKARPWSTSQIGTDLPAAETQWGWRVSLRQTQLEGTCRPCTTYSPVA